MGKPIGNIVYRFSSISIYVHLLNSPYSFGRSPWRAQRGSGGRSLFGMLWQGLEDEKVAPYFPGPPRNVWTLVYICFVEKLEVSHWDAFEIPQLLGSLAQFGLKLWRNSDMFLSFSLSLSLSYVWQVPNLQCQLRSRWLSGKHQAKLFQLPWVSPKLGGKTPHLRKNIKKSNGFHKHCGFSGFQLIFLGFHQLPLLFLSCLRRWSHQVGQRMKDSMEEAKTSSNSAKQKALLQFAKDRKNWTEFLGVREPLGFNLNM